MSIVIASPARTETFLIIFKLTRAEHLAPPRAARPPFHRKPLTMHKRHSSNLKIGVEDFGAEKRTRREMSKT